MLGLIKKDLLMIQSNLKIIVILLFVYGYMAYQGEMNISFLLPFMSVVIMMSTFSYDTYNKWDAYVVTLPDGRKNSVRAKYLATILLILITTILLTIFSVGVSYFQTGEILFEPIFSTTLGALFATALLQSVMYPSIYKFGIEKARIGIFLVIFGITIVGSILSRFIDFEVIPQFLEVLNDYWMVLVPIIIVIMLYVSLKISERIYKKKEY